MNTPLKFGVLGKRVALVAVASTIINVLLGIIGKAVSTPPDTFGPYMISSIISLTIAGVVAAGIVYAAMRRYVADTAMANRYFIWLSLVVLVVSFYPDVAMPWSTDADQVGWTYGIMANLMLMHVVAGGLVMYYFTKSE